MCFYDHSGSMTPGDYAAEQDRKIRERQKAVDDAYKSTAAFQKKHEIKDLGIGIMVDVNVLNELIKRAK